ncbi:MAG: hypothetical protein ACREJD_08315 [Phycisphaerales bacterium]
MSDPRGTLSLDVLAVHGPKWSVDQQQAFVEGISKLLAAVEQVLRREHPSLRLAPCVTASAESRGVTDHTPALALLDVSTLDDIFASLVGRLVGLGVPCIFLCRKGMDDSIARLGLDMSRVFRYEESRKDLPGNEGLQREVRESVSTSKILSEMVYALWFPRSTNTIWVVCPQIHQPGEFADRSSSDYTYLDNLGDTDTLLELKVFLSRHYPSATIGHFSASDLPCGHTSGNLVIIGGPGEVAEIGNHTCQDMMREVGSCVSYSDDCQKMLIKRPNGATEEYEATLHPTAEGTANRSRFGLSSDRGCFARFPNPLNENTAVVLVNGIHTRGVLGAGRAFVDRRESLRNYHAVFASGVDPKRFECHFAVRVLNGEAQVPHVAEADIYPLGAHVAGGVVRPSEVAGKQVASAESVTVVFVAGDRGGVQFNQAQIPREVKAIQEALRACKFRDSIAFANPILAANARTVADANRDKPSIMHFAGHGDDRSLSFIADENILVSAAPASAQQLGEILREFSHRVRLCVLNTCNSSAIAEHLTQTNTVDAAIGWSGKVADSTAIAFSGALYAYLGDGLGIGQAVGLAAATLTRDVKPQLSFRSGIDEAAPIVQGGHGS